MNTLLVQSIGFLGAAVFALSYQLRSSRKLLFCQIAGCVIFAVQFLLMRAYTGALSLLVNIARNILIFKSGEWKFARHKAVLAVIILVMTAITILTWGGWISILPFAATVVTSIGYWTANAQKIRLSQMFGAPCSLLHDVIIQSWGGVLTEAASLLSILISIKRFGWKNLAVQHERNEAI